VSWRTKPVPACIWRYTDTSPWAGRLCFLLVRAHDLQLEFLSTFLWREFNHSVWPDLRELQPHTHVLTSLALTFGERLSDDLDGDKHSV
jgi:hypothetical protein